MLLVFDLTRILRKKPAIAPLLNFSRLTLNQSNIYMKLKKAGGMKITFQTPPKNLDEKMISNVLRDYKILNCEMLIRDEYGMHPEV